MVVATTGIDGHLAPGARGGQEMTGHAGDAGSGGDHLAEASRQDGIDGLVGTAAAIELNKHR